MIMHEIFFLNARSLLETQHHTQGTQGEKKTIHL